MRGHGWRVLKLYWMWATMAVAAVVVFSAITVPMNNWLTNTGFLVIGVAVALAISVAIELVRGQAERLALAEVLYVELAHQVARLCFDAESPWNQIRKPPAMTIPGSWPPERFRKFRPDVPDVYLACLPKLDQLGHAPAAVLVQFYYRQAAMRRDMDRPDLDGGGQVGQKALKLIAKRQIEALRDGKAALEGLQALVEAHAEIEGHAIAYFDAGRDDKLPGSLRDRIANLISE